MEKPRIAHLIYGPQGAGKTTFARQLAEQRNAVCFSIDEWMVRLYGDDRPGIMTFEWAMKRVKRCEAQILEVCLSILSTGKQVVLDLGFMREHDRQYFVNVMHRHDFFAALHFVDAPLELRKQRVLNRNLQKGKTFSLEVTPEMFDFMEKVYQAPQESELAASNIVDFNIVDFDRADLEPIISSQKDNI
jgi:predicted kinase